MILLDGNLREEFQENLEKRVLPLFSGRVLPFDLPCTHAYAKLIAKAKKRD